VRLQPNDVVVFGGDSVTYLGGLPGGWIDTFNRQVQQKNAFQNISVIPSGVGGNTAAMLDARLLTTVLNNNPTVVVIFIGINDVRHAPLNPDGSRDLSGYMSTIQDIVQKCRNCKSVRSIVLMTPMAIGDKLDGEGQWDTTIDAMAQDLRDFAAANGIGLIDLRRVVIQAEQMFNTQDKEFGVLMDQTLVHPTALGSQILAGTALMGFGQ
jgi:lysophospholipase L1-like esterase